MRACAWTMAIAGLLLCVGCDGFILEDIDGDWDAGTVRFTYGDNRTWTLDDVLIEVDDTEEVIVFSGYDDQELWA
ncbi:MAG: hypothetical protein AB7Y46_07185 [Armatimonadota bacterium]